MNQVLQNPQCDEIENKLGMVSLYRANMYQIMSKAVQYPTLELAESFLNGHFFLEVAESIEWVNGRAGMYNDSLEKLKEVSENQTDYSPRDMLKKMEMEYARLFFQHGQGAVSPYERDYNNEGKESIIASIEKTYNEVESAFFLDHHKSPDHIASELSYLSFLGQQEGESWLKGNMEEAKKWKIQERFFIVHHIRKWGISFFVKMEKSSELEAYKAVASVGKVFMTLEHGN